MIVKISTLRFRNANIDNIVDYVCCNYHDIVEALIRNPCS